MALRAVTMIREGVSLLGEARAVMIQARDGDGSQASHYDRLTALGSYQAGDYANSDTAAKASFDELDSLYSKVGTDAATSNVNAAILQACAKHNV